MIKLTEITQNKGSGTYELADAIINPHHFISAKTRIFTPDYAIIGKDGNTDDSSKPRPVSEIRMLGDGIPWMANESPEEIRKLISEHDYKPNSSVI